MLYSFAGFALMYSHVRRKFPWRQKSIQIIPLKDEDEDGDEHRGLKEVDIRSNNNYNVCWRMLLVVEYQFICFECMRFDRIERTTDREYYHVP